MYKIIRIKSPLVYIADIMTIVGILLLFIGAMLLCTLCYVLFAPIRIEIDSTIGYGEFSIGPYIKSKVFWFNDSPEPKASIDVPFYHKEFNLLTIATTRNKDAKKEANHSAKEIPKRPPSKFRFKRLSYKRLVALLSSFKINCFLWHLDTDDFCLNAQLYPLFYISSLQGSDIAINFVGDNRFKLDAENTGFRLLLQFIKPLNN